MGVFDKLFKKGDKDAQGSQEFGADVQDAETQVTVPEGESGADAASDAVSAVTFTAKDFHYSQSIFDRNLLGVDTYEIEPVLPESEMQPHDLIFGELVEMTEGVLTMCVIIGHGCEVLFNNSKEVVVSYSKYSESFRTKAKLIKSSITGINELDLKARRAMQNAISQGYTGEAPGRKQRKFVIQMMLCEEPVRYHRQHSRIVIDWDVYYKLEDGGQAGIIDADFRTAYLRAKIFDVSKGGFKARADRQLRKGAIIKCVVDVGFDQVSEGKLLCEVIRSYPIVGEAETYELTTRFTDMDDGVRDFLFSWLESIQPAEINATAKITILDGGLEALLELSPPDGNGADLTYDELCACIDGEGITHGIDHDLIKRIAEKPHYYFKYIVARCTPPVEGDDAVLTYNVEMNPSFSPKINEKGEADFRDMGHIQKVKKNDVLAERIPPTLGVPGIGVKGEVLEAVPGADNELPAGLNTVINGDNTALLAETDGFISIADGKVNVFDTYVVEGDVHNATGNIDHNGIVVVKGDVRQGFSVTAAGDVIVNGTVESASVKAGGTLVVRGGCVGEKNSVEASGNVAIKFIDGGEFKTGGSLTTSYVINAKVTCGGSVEMVDSGLIRNSHIIAKDAINAKTVGSERASADNTIVEVGNDPQLLDRHAELAIEIERISNEDEAARANIRGLMVLKYKDALTPEKEAILEKCKLLSQQCSEKHRELTEESMALKEKMEKLGYGSITVKELAYSGLKVIIGTRELVLRDTVRAAKFCRQKEGVAIEPLA